MTSRVADFGDVASRLAHVRAQGRPVHVVLYDAFPEERELLPRILATTGASVRSYAGSELRNASDLTGILTSMESGDVLFIEDIDRLSVPVQERIAEVIATGTLRVEIGKGPAAREVKIEIPLVNIVGTTIRPRSLVRPLREAVPFHVNCSVPFIETSREMLQRERAEKRAAYLKRHDE